RDGARVRRRPGGLRGRSRHGLRRALGALGSRDPPCDRVDDLRRSAGGRVPAIDRAPRRRSRPAAAGGRTGIGRGAKGGAVKKDRGKTPPRAATVERVQTGIRVEKRILKVLKALADLLDMTLGDLIEGIVLHAFDGKAPFSPETLRKVAELKKIYGLDLD